MSTLLEQLSFDAALERDEPWSLRARRYLEALTPGSLISSDALRRAIGDPLGISGNACGALFRRAELDGLLVYSGRSEMSERPSARGRWVRIWMRT